MNSRDFNLHETVALLERTPAVLNSLLRGLPAPWTKANEGENTMNAFDIVGHLIHGENEDWVPRAGVILEQGETGTFEPFDRWGYAKQMEGKSLDWLLDEFARARAQSLAHLRGINLSPEDFARRARHPAFGQVTLAELLATWAAHDLTHIHQLSRVLANRYREAVGPWQPYLGVMQCNGHSAP